jgi:methylmalonyl-CoA mutase
LPVTHRFTFKKKPICKAVDPWAGSYYVETLTHELAHKAWKLIQEVEELGGMAKAIETGIPKMRIEEASARKQARIDQGKDTIVGVNKYRLDKEDPIDILDVDNTAVRISQIETIEKLRADAINKKYSWHSDAINCMCRNRQGNLLALAVDAARKRASLRRNFDACEKVLEVIKQ